jgi:Zn-dependent oligopeptidase
MPRKKVKMEELVNYNTNGSEVEIELTEEEKLKFENYQLKLTLLNNEFQNFILQLQSKYGIVITDISGALSGKVKGRKYEYENKERSNQDNDK